MRIDFIAPCGITVEIKEYPTYSDSDKKAFSKRLMQVGYKCLLIKCPGIEDGCSYLNYLGFYELPREPKKAC